jgi:hypothetical protein
MGKAYMTKDSCLQCGGLWPTVVDLWASRSSPGGAGLGLARLQADPAARWRALGRARARLVATRDEGARVH